MGSISSVLLGLSTVPDPDLEISGGPRSSRPLDKTGEGSPKRIFPLFGPLFVLKIRTAPGAPPLDPPLCLVPPLRERSLGSFPE